MRRLLALLALALAACAPDVAPAPPRPPVDAGPPHDASAMRDARADARNGDDAGRLDPRVDPFEIAPSPTDLHVLAGEGATIRVEIARLPGFVAPVVLRARGLPPEIQVARTVARAGEDFALVTLTADQNAPAGPTPFMLTAESLGWLHSARITVSVDH